MRACTCSLVSTSTWSHGVSKRGLIGHTSELPWRDGDAKFTCSLQSHSMPLALDRRFDLVEIVPTEAFD